MGTDVLDSSELTASTADRGRFARLSPGWARAALALLAAMLVAAMIVPTNKPGNRSPWERAVEGPVDGEGQAVVSPDKPYDEDIALYEVAIERIQRGENYYDFIVPEQRARHYPVKPGIAVRLPTLAYVDAALGAWGQVAVAMLLMLAIVAAWWRKLGAEGADGRRLQRLGAALVFLGASLQLNRHYFPLHELWAGGLIALSFGLHRIGRNGQGGQWIGAVLVAALALSIRELTLPYVLLMAVLSLWNSNLREAAAWTALILVFSAGLAWHLSIVARHVLPTDPHGPPWLVMRGMAGWLANVVQSSNLRWLPHVLAGPAVVLMTFGWLGWKSPSGMAGFLLSAGYGVAFILVGRWDNFYWGAMIAPVMFAGLAFAPGAIMQLVTAARSSPN